MKKILFITFLFISFNSFAKISNQDSDKGNGGSLVEAGNVMYQSVFNDTAMKIKKFFIQNELELKTVFPEFNIKDLVEKIDEAEVEIINDVRFAYGRKLSKLGEGKCLAIPALSKIECSVTYLELFTLFPDRFYAVVLSKYLQLIGVEDLEVAVRIYPYAVLMDNDSLTKVRVSSLGFGNSMFVKTLKIDLGHNTNPSEKKLVRASLKRVKTMCKEEGKKVTFSQARVLDQASGMVAVRYICDWP